MRIATDADIPHIVDMVRRFHGTLYDRGYAPDRVEAVIASIMQNGVVFIAGNGFIAGTVMQNISDNGLTAHEVLWWSEDGRGQELRERFEAWAKAAGCNAVEFSFPSVSAKVGKVLARHGYKPETQVLRKEI